MAAYEGWDVPDNAQHQQQWYWFDREPLYQSPHALPTNPHLQNAYNAVDLQQQQYQLELPRLPLTPIQPLVRQPPASSTSTRRGPNSQITARELLAITQAAVDINFFAAKHGEKGAKTKQLADKVKALGYVGCPMFFA